MKPILVAAALASTLSAAAHAGEMSGTPGIGARQSTTASIHCDAMTGRERESCLRALHERDRTRAPNPTTGTRPPRESSPPPVKTPPAASRTPEAATARAADPKAPSGALIIDTPSGKLPTPSR